MKDIICFNIITKDNKLINPNKNMPILYEWEDDNDLFANMRNDDNFYEYLSNVCFNINNYQYAKISLIKYNIKSDSFEENETYIQNEYKLENIKDNNTFYLDYLLNILQDLYNYSLKKDYIINEENSKIDTIINIYVELKSKFEKKIISDTFINYVRSELQQKYNLSLDNTEYIINKFEEMIQ